MPCRLQPAAGAPVTALAMALKGFFRAVLTLPFFFFLPSEPGAVSVDVVPAPVPVPVLAGVPPLLQQSVIGLDGS